MMPSFPAAAAAEIYRPTLTIPGIDEEDGGGSMSLAFSAPIY
jgi:hypothetical protein